MLPLLRPHAILIALCATLRIAPARAETPPGDAACTAALDGHVVDAATHEPIPGATVRLGDRIVAETNEAGRFALHDLCPGTLVVTAERADYHPATQPLPIPAAGSLELALTAFENEVIVVEDKAPPPVDMRSTTELSGAVLERTRGRAFSDVLAEVPGVSQLRSATGMAKPIIRGQYGRRLLMLVDEVRHRGQDWGLDHAPEIDPFVADKITVVRGASGVRYGPDAIGGAVLVEPPPLLRAPGHAGELHLIGISNGLGGGFASRVQGAPAQLPGLAWQVEGSLRRLAASRTPDYPLDNTGTSEWNLGATAGYRRRGAEYKLAYLRYQARLGVCSCLRIESSEEFFAQLAQRRPIGADAYRADFEIERPSQEVAHDLALARGRWAWDGLGALTATYAFQYDHRREYDVVRQAITGPQFDFRLATHSLDLALDHAPIHLTDHLHLRGSLGATATAQHHRYRGLPLVPGHASWSTGAFAIERLIGHDFELEAGVRYDLLARTASIERQDFLRLVRSGQLALDACGASDRDPVACHASFHTASASLGGLWRLSPAWSAKLELSTASRPPNPDEQYLNGAAPSFPVLALGKPDLGPETTYAASATTTYAGARVTAEASAYANLIADYIYLAPAIGADGKPIFDVLIRGTFPRFATRAVDAAFYGADGGIAFAPVRALELAAQISMVRARNLDDDSYLVFVPPDRVRGSVTYRPPARWGLRDAYLSVSGTYVARQRRFDPVADFAPPPDRYFLLGAEAGAELRAAGHPVGLALSGTNLTNARYRDYTSLLRYFADQPGWQLLLRLSVRFSSSATQ